MHETGIKLLKLMFKPGESICISHNKYGYCSIPLEMSFSGKVPMIPTVSDKPIEYVDSNGLKLVALNPMKEKSFRQDVNCISYRNFLIELDTGSLKEQLEYVKKLGMPYSACVFSGNKSLHFLLRLDKDLPSEDAYRKISEWILCIVTLADQNTRNPSRSIRVPGAIRSKGQVQRLVELKDIVTVEELASWLNKYPHLKPKKREKRQRSKDFSYDKISEWAKKALMKGLDPKKGRNKQWFSIACEFALSGLSESDTIDILSEFFEEERDFKTKEWEIAISSAFKYIYENRK